MPQHTMKRFDKELNKLKERMLAMGGLVERAIANAVKAMLEHDTALAEEVVKHDKAINALEVQGDELTKSILVRRQPAAGDLRFIIAMIKVVTDLERMGDLAAGIAEGVLRMQDHLPKTYSNLEVMGEKVERQVNRALDALAHGDIDLAFTVIKKDEAINELYKGMYREMITYMLEDPRSITSSLILSNAAKNLERIADHATNIAEMVIYMARGHDVRHVDHEAAAALLRGDA